MQREVGCEYEVKFACMLGINICLNSKTAAFLRVSGQSSSSDGYKFQQSYSRSSFFVIILKGRHSIDVIMQKAGPWPRRASFDNRIIIVDIN